MRVAFAYLRRVLHRQNMIAGLVGIVLGSGFGFTLLVWAEQRPPVVIHSAYALNEVATRGNHLDILFELDRRRDCPTETSRWLWIWIDHDGTQIKQFFPLTNTTTSVTDAGDDQEFVLSIPLPAGLWEGTWFYWAKTVEHCSFLPALFRSPIRETPDIAVQITGADAVPRTVGAVIPVAISLDLTVPAFAAQSGPRITPKGGVSFYANGYHSSLARHPMTPFDQAFRIAIGEEGGFTTNPADPGNWTGGTCGKGACRGTKFGIAASAHPDLDIASISLDQAKQIYHAEYWSHVQGDDMLPPLALLVFDAAVNCGPARAIRWLQAAVGVAQDGMLGPATIAALQSHTGSGAGLCAEFQARRLIWMTTLPTWSTFGLGWSRRLCRLPYDAVGMAAA